MPIAKKTEDGQPVWSVQCDNCGCAMAEMKPQTKDHNYECFWCGNKAKEVEKK